MTFEYGQIILAPVADGRGNVKPHPAIILTPTDQITPGESIQVVCISSQVEDPSPTYHIPLPWQRPRHPRTGLNKPNVAKCNWLTRIDPADVIEVLGFAPPDRLARIEEALRTLSGEPE
jgi:hypothetical protein